MTESISRKFSRLGLGVSETGTLTVNSATATKWATARTLTLSGDLSGNVSIDGSDNVTLTATVSGNTVALGTDTTGDYVASVTAGTGITTTGTGEGAAVTVALSASGVTANSYGSSTAVPVLTIDTYGRITSASTASVSSSINIAGDTGTDSVSLISDTLTVSGGTGLTSTVTNNTVTLDIDSTVATLTGSQTLTNKTISGADNTLSNIGNASLTNSSITVNGTSIALGASGTLYTDDVAEDASPVNLWFTNTRARSAVSATDAGGDGGFSYDSGTGVFTYTGPSAAEVRAHFSNGTGVTITNGQVAIGQAVATTDNVTFAGVTADNVRVGVTAAGEIDTSTGNLTLDSAGGTITLDDNATITGDLQIDGNLTVSGTTVTINATNLAVEDNMIYLNNGSTVTNPDLGFAGNYNDGTYRHAGVFRDATDGVFKFFHQYTPEPDASAYIDTSHGSFALASVQASTFTGNLVGNASTVTNGVYTTDTGTVTNTMLAGSIANNKLANSTISGVALGSNLGTLTLGVSGTGLSGSQTYNGSGAATFTVTSNATSANTGSTIVARDASGNFSAGTITATLSGNASTATSATSASNSTTTSQRAFTSDISTTGQGRFTGWYTGNAATGLATEAGVSSGQSYLISYNRDTSSYGVLNINGSTINIAPQGGSLTGPGGNVILHAGNYTSYTYTFDSLTSKGSGTGTYTTSGDFRAPIFYDSNDTTFYVNPNGKSELSSLALGYTSGTVYNTAGQGTLFFNNHGESDIQGYSIGTTMEDYGGNYTKLTIDWHTGIKIGAYTSYGGIRFYSNSVKYYGGSKLFSIGEGDGHVRATNVLFGGESVRSPIFYDSNDTGYYVDPRSASVLSGLKLNGVDNQASGGDYILWVNKPNNNDWAIAITGQLEYQFFYDGAASHSYGVRGLAAGSEYWRVGTDLLYHNSNIRAPIFYDSNNTGYYVNPDSTSYLYHLELSGGAYFQPNSWIQFNSSYGIYWPNHYGAHLYPNTGSTYTQLRIDGSKGGYSGMWMAHSGVNGMMYDSSGNGGVYREANGLWYFYYLVGNGCMGIGTSTTSSSYGVYVVKGGYFDGRVDGTIFYDANNTGYYCDPNGTARLSYVVANGGIRIDGNENLYLDNNYGQSIVGVYTSTRYQGVFAMGNSYKLPIDGSSTGSLYGLAWSHPNAGGVAGNLNTHGLLAMENGGWLASLTGSTRSRDDMRAPRFYDNNDTGYYADFNENASVYGIRMRSGILMGPNYTWGAYLLVGGDGKHAQYQNSGDVASVVSTNGNLHLDAGSGKTMYLNYYDGDSIYFCNGGNGVWGEWSGGVLYSYSQIRGTIFYDYNNTGYYVDPNSSSQMSSVYANDWFRPQGSTGLYFQDYGYGLRSAHGEGNSYGNATTYGSGRNGWSGWGIGTRHVFMSTTGDNVGVHDNSRGWIWYWNGSYTEFPYGYTIHGGSSRSPIFYDQNDTGYYCDPASTSYMYRTIFQGRMLFYGADQSADGTNDAQIYFTPGGGLTVASITTTFETGFVGSSYPNNRQAGAQATYDKRFYVWQDLVQYYSDERLKEKTGTLVGALDAIKSWTPFKYVDNALANSFNFGSDKPQIGLSAQEVQQYYPELVELAPFDVQNDFSDETNPHRVSKSGENYLTLNYTRLVPVLVQAIKEQQAKIEELERRINNS